MGKAFDFATTPITEQTTLVARYRSTSGGGAYGGKWFRVTTSTGQRYVPDTLESANAFSAATQVSLRNEDTGDMVSIAPADVVRLELGGGWQGVNVGGYVTRFFQVSVYFKSLKRISGYAEGLTSGGNTSSGMFFGFTNSAQRNQAVDFTGFKFDNNQFTMLTVAGAAFYPNLYGSSGSLGGGYGIVEPVETASSAETIESSVPFSEDNADSATLNKGWGLVGPYAKEWLEKYPPTSVRNIYLG